MLFSIFLIACAYFMGAIPIGYLIVKKIINKDIRKFGSGGIGCTNVYRICKTHNLSSRKCKKWAFLTFLGDFAKGLLPIVIVKFVLGYDSDYLLLFLIVIAPILGHCFSAFISFKGGKAIATSFGTIITILGWEVSVSLIIIFVVVFFFWKYVSLSSLIASSTLLLGRLLNIYISQENFFDSYVLWLTGAVIFIFLIAFIQHRDNIMNLLKGKERKIRL
ncbi:MAG: glycerol-3-phosphate 1-O-acyltransferase PlsY [bacterium]